jgi:hypothetical protein
MQMIPSMHGRKTKPFLYLHMYLVVLLSFMVCFTKEEDVHLLNDDDFYDLSDEMKEEMKKREVENCVPCNIRSWILGKKGIIEWDTRRTYIPKVHRKGKGKVTSPWQSCSEDSSVQVRYKKVGASKYESESALTFYSHHANFTTHKAWISIERPNDLHEFIVGSTFHGWSNIHLLGKNRFLSNTQSVCRPKHVHTAYGKIPGSFSVQWTTGGKCPDGKSQLRYSEGFRASIDEKSHILSAQTNLFTDDGPKQTQRYMHVVELTGLKSNTHYTYIVGNDVYAWSIPFFTKTAPLREDIEKALPMRFLVTGDIGYQNAVTLPMMQSEVADGAVDAVVSVGDYAYDLNMADGHVGDIFMEEMEPIASKVPFMVTPGNHEVHNTFSHYTERFRLMPSNTGNVISGAGEAPNNWFYSFNVGLVHFAFISTEIYFKKTLEPNMVERQLEWLRQDLAAANTNRNATPWLIVIGHRPMYCTSDKRNCGNNAALLRASLEDLFYEQGVDLYVCGHQHNYERMYDVYKSKTWKRTTNMKATTHILSGASGQYMLSIMRKSFEKEAQDFDAFRNSIFGYSRLQVYNSTHIKWQQVQSDPENPAAHGLYGQVTDDVWLIQENHGSFLNREYE